MAATWHWIALFLVVLSLFHLVTAEGQENADEEEDLRLTPKRFVFAVSMYTVVMLAGRWIIAHKPRRRSTRPPKDTSIRALSRGSLAKASN